MINNYFDSEYKPYHEVYTHSSGNKIYIGDVAAALDSEFIKDKNISIGIDCIMKVITAALGMQHVHYEGHIQHLVYPLLDKKSENMTKHFLPFYQLTERQIKNKNMLVHCFAGISRSATLVISYLMKKHKWTFKQAISFVRKSRPTVLPNLGFERQLKQYEKQLKNQEQSFSRKLVSKTSQSRKAHSKQNKLRQVLPEIVAFGKTIAKSKMVDPLMIPGSQIEQRKARLPHFMQGELQENNKLKQNNMQIKHLALKSYRRRSISQANKKSNNFEKINKILMGQGRRERGSKLAPSVNELRFATEKLIKPKVRLYDGF